MRRIVLVAALLVVMAEAAAAALELRSEQSLTSRLRELVVYSPALERETSVRVLLPEDYDPEGEPLPVLLLLHGGWGSFVDWTLPDVGEAEAITAGLPLIVVMPDGGQGGWYSDWKNATTQGAQRWETYHLRELLPFVHAHYDARADRAGNGVAGLSMGGFGAVHYAARRPDLFGFVAAFSGAVDNQHPDIAFVMNASPLIMGGDPGDIWGDPVLEEARWRANNPIDLAANLRHVAVELRTGDGDPDGPSPDVSEVACAAANATLHERLTGLGIAHVHFVYPGGTHTWPYWRDGLAASLPGFLAVAAARAPAPVAVDYRSLEPSFSAWGFDVALDRPVYETAILSVRRNRFSLTGTGAATVTTPPRFAPDEEVELVVESSLAGPQSLVLTAGPDGRLTVPLDLGPASTVDEYPEPPTGPPALVTAQVRFVPEPARAATAAAAAAALALLARRRSRRASPAADRP